MDEFKRGRAAANRLDMHDLEPARSEAMATLEALFPNAVRQAIVSEAGPLLHPDEPDLVNERPTWFPPIVKGSRPANMP